MTVPKYETIKRYCSNSLAIEVLRERGIITDSEAKRLYSREQDRIDEAYAKIYGRSDK